MDLNSQITELETKLQSLERQRDAELHALDAECKIATAEQARELLVLQDAIDDAKRRRRSQSVEGLNRRFEELLAGLVVTNILFAGRKEVVREKYAMLSRDDAAQLKRLKHQRDTAAAIARNRELQEKRYRKIPVLK